MADVTNMETMFNIVNDGNTLNITDGVKTWSFPTNKVVLTQDDNSNSVNIKLLGSRKTILTIVDKKIKDFN